VSLEHRGNASSPSASTGIENQSVITNDALVVTNQPPQQFHWFLGWVDLNAFPTGEFVINELAVDIWASPLRVLVRLGKETIVGPFENPVFPFFIKSEGRLVNSVLGSRLSQAHKHNPVSVVSELFHMYSMPNKGAISLGYDSVVVQGNQCL